MRAVAKITVDNIETGQVGRVFEVDPRPDRIYGTWRSNFNLLDDDNISYYRGTIQADSEGLDYMIGRLWDWGGAYAGTTMIKIDGELVIG